MKFVQILSHPVIQIASFCIILISGPYFGAPYAFYLFHAVQQGHAFAVVGIIAILINLASAFIYRPILQLTGTILMVISLVIYFTPPNGKNSYDGFVQVVPLITMILFVIITVTVIQRNISRVIKHA